MIIDDDDDFYNNQKKYLVQTDPSIGLSEDDVKKAIEILNCEDELFFVP